jgi:hypothetical protein
MGSLVQLIIGLTMVVVFATIMVTKRKPLPDQPVHKDIFCLLMIMVGGWLLVSGFFSLRS